MHLSRLLLACLGFLALVSVESSFAGKEKKKDGKADLVGVIASIHRDENPKDSDIGHLVITANKKDVKITVLKSTGIFRAEKKVDFKALDKGDHVAVFTKDDHPHVANKIVIKKD